MLKIFRPKSNNALNLTFALSALDSNLKQADFRFFIIKKMCATKTSAWELIKVIPSLGAGVEGIKTIRKSKLEEKSWDESRKGRVTIIETRMKTYGNGAGFHKFHLLGKCFLPFCDKRFFLRLSFEWEYSRWIEIRVPSRRIKGLG